MQKLFRVLVAAAVMAAAVAIYAGVAAGHGGNGHAGKRSGQAPRHGAPLLRESLAPSQPTDPTFHGVTPGGAPWVLSRGQVRIKRDGKLVLSVRGLVIPNPPGNATPGPVTTVSASLYCGADSDTTAAVTSASVPISSAGNARIVGKSFGVPGTCLAPVILVHPNGVATKYIAVDGWRP
jgi:hypothetical protein